MIFAAACLLALTQQDAPPQRDGPPGPILLAIYQEHAVFLNGVSGASTQDTKGQSMRFDRLGQLTWNVVDGGLKGVPCKLFTGETFWNYKTTEKNSALKDYHTAKVEFAFDIGLDGVPIHTESHFSDIADRSMKTVDVVADYGNDHIDETITKDGVVEKQTLYPSFGMELFAGMFDPIMRSGLIQHDKMDCAVLHPFTGQPYLFKLSVRSRFTGYFFFLNQAGYCVDVNGAEGDARAYLTRQGQLLQVDLSKKISASLELGPMADERRGWGTFDVRDWDKSTDETNPERPVYHTLAIPIPFKNPNILFPVPCALTD